MFGDFVRQEHTAGCGTDDDGGARVAEPVRKLAAESLKVPGVLQHLKLFQVAGAVLPGGEPKVPLQKRPAVAEDLEDLVAGHARFAPPDRGAVATQAALHQDPRGRLQ